MQIVHVITTIDFGGAEKQLLALSAQQVREGHSVHVVFLKGKPSLLQRFTESGVIVNQAIARLVTPLQPLYLFKLYCSNRQAVFHAHLPRAELFCSLVLPLKCFVVTRHNAEKFMPNGPKVLSNLMSKFVLLRAFCSISISRAVQDFLTSYGEMNNSKNNHIIYYGLDTSHNFVKIKRIKTPNIIEVGTISRLVPQKNIHFFLRIAKELNSRHLMRFQFNILGTGPLKEELTKFSDQLGVSRTITWINPTENVGKFYESLDLFLLTSKYEGFGLVLLEAAQHGLPIVANNTSAIPEVLSQLHPGLVQSSHESVWADKIMELLTNKKLFEDCLKIQEGQLIQFSIAETSAKHNILYNAVLGKRSFVRG